MLTQAKRQERQDEAERDRQPPAMMLPGPDLVQFLAPH
jgi:hypothetical protein